MMRWKDYKLATSPDQAVEWLGRIPEARVIAGGTDVVVQLDKRKVDEVQQVTLVDVAGIPELAGVVEEDDYLVVGAATTMAELAASELVDRYAPALAEGARAAASPIIRQVATVGGNLVNASPAADTVPGLIVAGAVAEIRGPEGLRELSAWEVQTGPGRSALREREILTKLRIPKMGDGEGQAFLKRGKRKALSISIVNVAARVLTEDGGRISDAVVVLGAVAPRFVVVRQELLGLVAGGPLAEGKQAAVEQLVKESVSPISDLRASAEYRREMAGVIAWRALKLAYDRAVARPC